jgi:ethanolamine utilization microcompartment shell protein EutL
MKERRVTEITMQTDESFLIRRSRDSVPVRCAQCGSTVPMVSAEEAAMLSRVSVRLIYREIEAGQVHFQETSAGSVMVCLDSLRKSGPQLP